MKKIISVSKLFLFFSILSIVCFSSMYPSCNVSTASLSDARLCTSLNGSECSGDMTTFPADIPVVYCTASLKNAPSGTKVTFEWKHESETLGKADVETGSNVVSSTFKPTTELAPGKYSVSVKINTDNATPITKNFTVE